MTVLALIQGSQIALYHGRKQVGVWEIPEDTETSMEELVRIVRDFKED